jgi:hypothetical protein
MPVLVIRVDPRNLPELERRMKREIPGGSQGKDSFIGLSSSTLL